MPAVAVLSGDQPKMGLFSRGRKAGDARVNSLRLLFAAL